MTASTALTPSQRGASASSSSYDLRRNPPYQIDVTAASSGKRLAQTKRRVRWRFGFSHAASLSAGATGTDCRGEEHDVTLVWSLTSGKRLVLADGKEVHFSTGKATSGKFQTSWTMRGNHVLKIVAYAAPPLKARPGFRQFELFLDGMSFYDMPKIYELGVKAGGAAGGRGSTVVPYSNPRTSSSPSGDYGRHGGGQSSERQPYNNYSLPREEEMAWAQNVDRYEQERGMDRGYSETHVQAPPPVAEPEPSPAPARSVSVPTDLVSDPVSAPGQDLLASPNALLEAAAPPAFASPVAQDQGVVDFTPQPPPPAPVPTYDDVAGNILSQYGGQQQPPQQQALPALPPSTNYEQPQPPQQQPQYYEQQPPHPHPQQSQFASPPPPQQAQYYEQQPPPQQQYYEQQPPQQQQYYEQQPPQQQYYEQQPPPPAEYVTATPSKDNSDVENVAPPAFAAETPAAPSHPAITDGSPTGVADVEIDDVSSALKKLVNINDITEKPEEELELTMSRNPFDDKNKLREDQRKIKKGAPRSHGLPPTTNNWAMSNKCLAEVKESVPRRQPTREVMKPHAFDPAAAGAGMMVVYGAPAPPPPPEYPQQQQYQQQPPPQQQQYYQQGPPPQQQQHDYSRGPPPLAQHSAGGFGAGAYLPGGGYNNPQQQRQQVYAAR